MTVNSNSSSSSEFSLSAQPLTDLDLFFVSLFLSLFQADVLLRFLSSPICKFLPHVILHYTFLTVSGGGDGLEEKISLFFFTNRKIKNCVQQVVAKILNCDSVTMS